MGWRWENCSVERIAQGRLAADVDRDAIGRLAFLVAMVGLEGAASILGRSARMVQRYLAGQVGLPEGVKEWLR